MKLHPAEDPVRRRGGTRAHMLLRILARSATQGGGRALSALLAMVVAAAVATTMLNLYVDVQAKLRREFRNYGANVVVTAKEGQVLPAEALEATEAALNGRGLAVAFAYVVARTSEGRPVVVSGTDFASVRKLDRWWLVTGWPAAADDALVGVRAAAFVSPQSKSFDLEFRGRTIHLNGAGTVRTGASEDNRIYLRLSDFEAWTGVHPSTIEVAASGSPEEVRAFVRRLAGVLPFAEVRPIRQIMEGEARVVGKTRAMLFASSTLIILTAALCVLATLIGWVFDRRKDFAIMKALGGSERLVSGMFAVETAALGVVGAIIGFGIGVGAAAWIGRANFHTPVVPRFGVFPIVLAGSVIVALVAAVLPITMLRRVQPAAILRGE